jgi:hypothetical protein
MSDSYAEYNVCCVKWHYVTCLSIGDVVCN